MDVISLKFYAISCPHVWVGKIPRRSEWLPTPVFWPGEFHGLYSPWGHKESDMTEQLSLSAAPITHLALIVSILQTHSCFQGFIYVVPFFSASLFSLNAASLRRPSWTIGYVTVLDFWMNFSLPQVLVICHCVFNSLAFAVIVEYNFHEAGNMSELFIIASLWFSWSLTHSRCSTNTCWINRQ